MWSKPCALLFLAVHVSGLSLLDYLYPQKSPQLSGSYINAAAQITAHVLHQLAYKPNSTETNTTEIVHSVVFVEKDKDVFVFDFTNQDNGQHRAKVSNPTKTLKTLLVKLNNEAEKLGMDTYQGFNDELLAQMAETSKLTASSQLLFVLKKIDVEQVKNTTKLLLENVIKELESQDSELVQKVDESSQLIYLPFRNPINV